MAKYVALGRFRVGMDFADAKERVEKVKAALASVKAKLEILYYTMGPYDFVTVIDAPDAESAAAFLSWYAKLGVAETTTMPAFTLEEMQKGAGRIR